MCMPEIIMINSFLLKRTYIISVTPSTLSNIINDRIITISQVILFIVIYIT